MNVVFGSATNSFPLRENAWNARSTVNTFSVFDVIAKNGMP
jgi:hypothetical protein